MRASRQNKVNPVIIDAVKEVHVFGSYLKTADELIRLALVVDYQNKPDDTRDPE